MKVKVLIHRQTKEEPDAGTLRAWVVSEFKDAEGNSRYQKGCNLLRARQFSSVDSAVSACDAAVLAEFKLIDAPEIEYVIEDEHANKTE